MIAIGIDFGGPELKSTKIYELLYRLMNLVADQRPPNFDDGVKPWVNVIFIVPGTISRPDFLGYKIGHFSKKKKGLVVQVEVPASAVNGERTFDFIENSLNEAIRLAATHFASKGLNFPSTEAEKLLRTVSAELKNS
ncbi:hypothetical protein [Neorhizobium tomejilense]|uniref:hypothetical protein n=1 Tax=Neorhizobium tomejilense TaxID=2093828 RepID=UPI000CF985D6|nr:hypothetical protein [Neorhizobium tomejilense]